MKDEIIQFLKENIIGKNLFTDDVVYQLDNGKLEGVYSDKIVFSDLAKTENGFGFNMTTVTHELIYNIDGKGSRMTVAKDYTGTSVFRYELANAEKHQSTDRLYALYLQQQSKIRRWKPWSAEYSM